MNENKSSSVRERLKAAARHGQLDDCFELLKKSPKLNKKKLMSKVLIETCKKGHIKLVQWLVKNTRAHINYIGIIRDESEILKQDHTFSFTPLTTACFNNYLKVVQYLVEIQLAEVNLLDKGGFTPLKMACHRASYSVSSYLLNAVNDLDINIANSKKQNTALHYAIWCNKPSRTPLHEACEQRDANKVRELTYSNFYIINVQDNSGFTPLHTACYYGFEDIVEILMVAGADETITNDHRRTPAQLATDMGHTELLKSLTRKNLWIKMHRPKSTIPIAFMVVLALQSMRWRYDDN